MNFVGHTMVAGWGGADPGVALGSMLPDLARMSGARTPSSASAAITHGIALHHQADAVFHESPEFLRLCSAARTALRARGVGRATALGAAHVGVELLLDGAWLDEDGVPDLFASAIDHGQRTTELDWTAPADADRFATVCARLSDPASVQAYRDPEAVGWRLHRILGLHPRLAPQPADRERLQAWATTAQPEIVASAAVLRHELHQALATSPRAERDAPAVR